MAFEIEVLYSPAEFRALAQRDLSTTTCVVFDVLRATSTIVTALAAGASGVLPVGEIHEAVALHKTRPDILLAGEREGLRISANLTGGVEFDLGNSPREFTAERVAGKLVVMTTTNGTRALQACAGAAEVVVGSFLNLTKTAHYLTATARQNICLICAGTGEQAALEDTIAAGAMCEELQLIQASAKLQDSALIAHQAFLQVRNDLADAISKARNARRLLGESKLRDDVEFCLRRNRFDIVGRADSDKVLRGAR